MSYLRNILSLVLVVAFLLPLSSCSLFRRDCMDKQTRKLIKGKETYGVKNKKYKKQSRKAMGYSKR